MIIHGLSASAVVLVISVAPCHSNPQMVTLSPTKLVNSRYVYCIHQTRFFFKDEQQVLINLLCTLKICEPVKKLTKCRYFRDITWTFINYPDNTTQQVMHCLCPKNSVAYIIKRQAYQSDQGVGYQYSFACSPQSVSLYQVFKITKPYF